MNFRAALFYSLLVYLSLPFMAVAAPYGISTGGSQQSGPLGLQLPATYRGHSGKYGVAATFQTNGLISAIVYNRTMIVPVEDLVSGVGNVPTNGVVDVSFGELGYLKGRLNRNGTKITARFSVQVGDKLIKRSCVLKREAWNPGSGSAVVTLVQAERPVLVSRDVPPRDFDLSATNTVWLSREEAELYIAARRIQLQQQSSGNRPPILPPTGYQNRF